MPHQPDIEAEAQSLANATLWAQWARSYTEISPLSDKAMALLREALRDWARYAPYVLSSFEQHVALMESAPLSDDQGTLFCALGYLLSVQKAAGAFAAMQRLALAPVAHREDFMQDMGQEIVPVWLAACCHHDQAQLDWLRDLMLGRIPGSSWAVQCAAHDALLRCSAAGLVAPQELGAWLKARCQSWAAQSESGPWTDPLDHTEMMSPSDYLSCAIVAWQDAYFTADDLPLALQMHAQAEIDPRMHPISEIEETRLACQDRLVQDPQRVRHWPAPDVPGLPSDIEYEIRRVCFDHERINRNIRYSQLEAVRTPQEVQETGLPYMRPNAKVGRNDPCTCGSGLKFKKCCGKG